MYDAYLSELQQMPSDEEYLRLHRQSFGARPIRIITAFHHYSDSDRTPNALHLLHLRLESEIALSESRLLDLSSNAKQVFAYRSGYYSQLDQPDIVMQALREAYDQSRTANPAH